MIKKILSLAVPLAVVTACGGGGGGDDDHAVTLYKSLGRLQCTGGGVPLSALVAELNGQGIPVSASACGNDGLVRVALCGVEDGSIGVVDVPESKASAAAALGYRRLDQLPSAVAAACP